MYLSFQVFSIAVSVLFLVLLPFRLSKLRKETIKVIAKHHGERKLMVALLLSFVQFMVLITGAFPKSEIRIHVFSSTASFLACLGLYPLLLLEHTRSIKPSDLATLYLLASFVCSSVDMGTTLFEHGTFTYVVPGLAISFLKFMLLVSESRGKEKLLRDSQYRWPPEQLSGVLGKAFLWWINPILAQGNRNVLTSDNLPPLDRKLSSRLRRQKALQAWDQRAKPETRRTLPKVLVLSMLPHFLAPILPRLLFIAFCYAQPVLISTAIRFISQPPLQSSETGYPIILMAVIIYVGLAISRAWYQHSLNRLEVMIRGAVVGLINNKSLNQRSNGYDDSRAVTLMSTDAHSVGQTASMIHDTLAQILEVVIGMTMLARQVGLVVLVPLFMIIFCSRISRYLAKGLENKQMAWNVATQKRISMTTSMLNSMKSLKMLGVTTYVESLVQNLRLWELNMAMQVRWIMVAYNASANALLIFTPILTFVLYALLAGLKGSALDAETAFTTTALLALVIYPAHLVISTVPQAVGSLAAFERIQQYFLEPPRHDSRLVLNKIKDKTSSLAICFEDVTIQTNPSMPPLLANINLVINRGSIAICSGPVGSGKTMLSKALMGELPTARGTIAVSSTRIAWCEQTPWLPNGTIKEVICGFWLEDPHWYDQIIRACGLDEDCLALPNGDKTIIGSRGLNLSGGQRQRVALARALYARCEIVVLDDSFSALDGKTEIRIVENLLGPGGLLRQSGTTVFLITNSATHFHLADLLFVLGDGIVKYQGTWTNYNQDLKHILKVPINEKHISTTENTPQMDYTMQSQSLKVADARSNLSRATGDLSLYAYYLRAVGVRNFLRLVICTASYSFFITFPQYWLVRWTEAPVSQTKYYIGVYFMSSLMAWTFTNGSMWSTHVRIAPESGVQLHQRLLSTITRAPLLYFSTTDIGATLNRFSQDMQLIDKSLPPSVLSLLNQVFKLMVQMILLFSAQKLLALTLPFCVIAVYLVQRIYLRTSRQLRLLDLESQSAVYSSFLESVEGIASIRAFGWEKQVEDANIVCLDKSQQPSYVLLCLKQWLRLVLDLMVAALATSFITLAVLMRGTTTAGQIGMALNIVLVASSALLGLVTSWTNMEISMGAISRLKSLETETPKEDKPWEDATPLGTWPSSGAIELDDVTVAYNSEALALKDVTMKISAGQQVAICGRTGSGKSTLLLTLLRLLDIKSGTIRVDGVDLSLIPRSIIRQKCFVTVAQDPFVLAQASLRLNLDLSASLPDEVIVAALRKTYLWSHFIAGEFVSKIPGFILDTPIASLPQMSSGQVQLFAVARAILQLESLHYTAISSGYSHSTSRVMPIILFDEATSSLDPETDNAIRNIIRQEFTEKGHTVIAITHRLGGLVDSLRSGQAMVALLTKGKVERVGGIEDILGLMAE